MSYDNLLEIPKNVLNASIRDALKLEARRCAADELHARALEVLRNADHLVLPQWTWAAPYSNPPSIRDRLGNVVASKEMREIPERITTIKAMTIIEDVQRSFGIDAVAEDDEGHIHIIVYVRSSARAVRIRDTGGQVRRLEIDLSALNDGFKHDDSEIAVSLMDDRTNRFWVTHPVEADWDLELDCLIRRTQRKKLFPRHRKEGVTDTERKAIIANDRRFRELDRLQTRRAYHRILDELEEMTSPAAIELALDRHWARDKEEAELLLSTIKSPAVVDVIRQFHHDAWVFDVHPVLWQCSLFKRRIEPLAQDEAIEVFRLKLWFLRVTSADETMHSLFAHQSPHLLYRYPKGTTRRPKKARFFSQEENARIPNLYAAVSDFIDRLVGAGVLREDPKRKGFLFRVRLPCEDANKGPTAFADAG